ncbi:branched-chain amino acid ABC transporter substrate-binding protein [Methylobacterium symbioticum]|uniref:Leucine-, isoleucine-, valine-, threonine-, and alanine-binding protein n=1 Tax=Methylobacterium symbioticum TaxID=2584084 RepID=A0A509E9J0_9HYPH|nr:branched-chain amino acid ABC transporter substrate-binding protein [Methylobacterium symbioticum]VUD69803.1 Leucine-, isoleucine-, valine-, threonine-, and alanine-binding protein [Methylobacterium symbioticum]
MRRSLTNALIAGAALIVAALSPAEAKDTVKIAFIGPLTGGNAAAGVGGRNSSMLAVQLRNADPKAKFAYELVPFDDECKPNIGVQVATKAAADRAIVAGVTHYCSAVGIATVDTYARFKLPVVVWGAILPDITYGNDYKQIHRVNGTMINEGKLAAQFLTARGFKTFAVVHDTTDYGKGQNKYFSEYLKPAGGEIVATFPVSPDQQDFTAELTRIKELKPDMIFVGGLTPLGVRVRSQMERLGVDARMAGVSGIMTAGFLEGAGAAAEGTISFHNGAPLSKYADGQAFADAYARAGFREDPDAYGPFAYSAANLIMDAVEKVGPDRAKITAELNATKGRPSLIGEINFDDHRQNIVTANVYVAQGGKWVFWPDSEYAAGKRTIAGR